MFEYTVNTNKEGFFNITSKVTEAVAKSGVKNGICLVFCPHTTAGVTINENADPDVVIDLLNAIDTTFPDRPTFRHEEGNSHAHLKSSVIGSNISLIVENGKVVLGQWQGIYFTEFDGPRTRHFMVQVVGN